MLRFIEFGLLAVSLLIIFGLVGSSPRPTQPAASDSSETGDVEMVPLHKL